MTDTLARGAPPTRPAPTSTRTPMPRRRTSCRSRASTMSSSGWATRARRRPTTARCGASRRSPSPASRPAFGTGPATSCGRTTSRSCSPRRSRRTARSPSTSIATATACTTSRSRSTTSSGLARDDDAGARPALEYRKLDGGEDGTLRRTAVQTYGDVLHSFVDRNDYHGVFAPGFRKVKKPARAADGLNLLEVDHCVGNVELGEMDEFVDYYRDVFGFSQLIHYDDKVIHTEYWALMSKVMTNGNGRVKFPINEPATGKKKSQIQEFLDWYLDAGTQHVALRTEDIVGTVRPLRENGVEFLGLPHEYYATLARPCRRRRRPDRDARGAGHRGRPRRGGLSPPDLHPAGPGSADLLLRDHRAARLARLRRRQLQGAVRGDRARAGEAREPLGGFGPRARPPPACAGGGMAARSTEGSSVRAGHGVNSSESTMAPASASLSGAVPGKYSMIVTTRVPATSMMNMRQVLSGPWE